MDGHGGSKSLSVNLRAERFWNHSLTRQIIEIWSLMVHLDGKKVREEKWKWKWGEGFLVIFIYPGTHKFSLSISHSSWAPQTFTSHHYIIYLYFPSLSPYTQFHFQFHYTLSCQPNWPLDGKLRYVNLLFFFFIIAFLIIWEDLFTLRILQ